MFERLRKLFGGGKPEVKPDPVPGLSAPAKSRPKSRGPSAPLVPQPHGGALKPGGSNPGAGRPKEVWRARVREALGQAQGVEFLVQVVKGEALEESVNAEGEVVRTAPKIRDRIVAANILIEQAHGKPPQEVRVEDERPRQTGEQIMADILELLPKVIPVLPVDHKEIGRLLAERKRIEVLVQGRELPAPGENGDNAVPSAD